MQDTKKIILVVDDQSGIRESLTDLLSHATPYPVTALSSGDEALPWLELHASEVGCILLDDVMPGNFSGFQALPIIKDRFPHIAIFMIGALLSQRPMQEYLTAGAKEVISKPWNVDELLTLIRRHMDCACGPLNPA